MSVDHRRLDAAAEEAAPLALKTEGNTLTVMVRRCDFRLILVTPAKGNGGEQVISDQ